MGQWQDKTASHGTPCCDGGACEHKEGGCLVHQATDSEEFANIQEAELVGRSVMVVPGLNTFTNNPPDDKTQSTFQKLKVSKDATTDSDYLTSSTQQKPKEPPPKPVLSDNGPPTDSPPDSSFLNTDSQDSLTSTSLPAASTAKSETSVDPPSTPPQSDLEAAKFQHCGVKIPQPFITYAGPDQGGNMPPSLLSLPTPPPPPSLCPPTPPSPPSLPPPTPLLSAHVASYEGLRDKLHPPKLDEDT